jgi:hypothetical protein
MTAFVRWENAERERKLSGTVVYWLSPGPIIEPVVTMVDDSHGLDRQENHTVLILKTDSD